MISVHQFIFNDFYENTYILYDETKECVILDPGCNTKEEQNDLDNFIIQNNLTPVGLVNTHCHIDHVLGNAYCASKYNLQLSAHQGEQIVLSSMVQIASMYGVNYIPSPPIELFYEEGQTLQFGDSELKVLFTPGHSPASISFYSDRDKILICGDVLFQGSIGRTDLPGGNFDTLIKVIKEKFFVLPDEVTVYSGHGDKTTIGIEKRSNPFFVN